MGERQLRRQAATARAAAAAAAIPGPALDARMLPSSVLGDRRGSRPGWPSKRRLASHLGAAFPAGACCCCCCFDQQSRTTWRSPGLDPSASR